MFSLRQIFVAIGIVSVISLVISMGLAGQGWAMGIAFGVALLAGILLLMMVAFMLIELLSQMVSATEAPTLDDYSPFRAERPEKLPEPRQEPNLEQMIPGWDQDGSPKNDDVSQGSRKPPIASPRPRPEGNSDI